MSFMAEMDKSLMFELDRNVSAPMSFMAKLDNICCWVWQAGLRCEETIKAFLSVATVNIFANQSHPIDQKLPELLIKLKYLGFPLKNSMFKVDTATVGSLLDNTNASNWRDALLQVLT